MTPRQRRMTLVFGIIAGVGIAGALALSAFRSNVTFFFDPTAVAAGQVKSGEHFRLGGMVTKGSVRRQPGSLEVSFVVTDFKHNVPVSYTGVLPDLFREGTGVVAHGHMDGRGTFVADEVLAKHDEKYMPPEVAHSLKRRHGEAREEALSEGETPAAGGGAQGQAAETGSQGQHSPPSTTSTRASAPGAAGMTDAGGGDAQSAGDRGDAQSAANAGDAQSVASGGDAQSSANRGDTQSVAEGSDAQSATNNTVAQVAAAGGR